MSEKKNKSPESHLYYGRNLIASYQVEQADREELEIAYQTLNAIFACTPDGLVAIDDALVIQQANRAFSLLVEMPPKEVLGRLLTELLPCPELIATLQQLAAQPERPTNSRPTQVEINVRQPVKRSLLANIARLRAGRFQGWIIVLHDQSERKQLERQKNAFINIAAHELRTPLTAVRGFTELLTQNSANLQPQQKKLLDGIHRGGVLLQTLINDLLKFAELYSGAWQESAHSGFALKPLLRDLINELQSYAIQRQVELKLDIQAQDIVLTADIRLLHTALYQLLLNAINFNRPNGWATITANLQEGRVIIHVADTGHGIPQTELDQIFYPFYQIEEHWTRRIGGLGLGLAMVHRAAAQLGGHIEVASVLEEGSTFSLILPQAGKNSLADDQLRDIQAELEASQRQSFVYAQNIRDLKEQMQRHFLATLHMITELMEARDEYMHGHSQRVAATAVAIAHR